MFKVSFKAGSKKVETFNNKATVVTLTGKMILPTWFNSIPSNVFDWAWHHPTVNFDGIYTLKEAHIVVSGKSVCAKGDTFDAMIGERIAESRAKIKLYKFMQTLMYKLSVYYTKLLKGNECMRVSDFYNNNSLLCTWRKYTELLEHERYHLDELLQKTV